MESAGIANEERREVVSANLKMITSLADNIDSAAVTLTTELIVSVTNAPNLTEKVSVHFHCNCNCQCATGGVSGALTFIARSWMSKEREMCCRSCSIDCKLCSTRMSLFT